MKGSAVDISLIEFVQTAHDAGQKKILFRGKESAMTQFAFARLERLEHIHPHAHATMDEYFYFLSGTGKYIISGEAVELYPGVAVQITAGTIHELFAENTLEFVYFGIAI